MGEPNTLNNSAWVSVTSSRIAAMKYDESMMSLDIRFRNGRIYRYTNVVPSLYTTIAGADSIGSEFQTAIVRNKNLTVNEITNESEAHERIR